LALQEGFIVSGGPQFFKTIILVAAGALSGRKGTWTYLGITVSSSDQWQDREISQVGKGADIGSVSAQPAILFHTLTTN
jgi:hypothetical protein